MKKQFIESSYKIKKAITSDATAFFTLILRFIFWFWFWLVLQFYL